MREAIGAGRTEIHILSMRQLALPCTAGVLLGCLCGDWLARPLSSYLFGVGPAEPAPIAAAIILKLLIGLAAASGALVRANRVDAVTALRAL
jgi:hypothetical protein